MEAFTEEPVRGSYGDFSWVKYAGIETARRFVQGTFPRPPIHHLVGLTPTEAGIGSMTFSMPVTEWLQDGSGIIWGGIYAMLADAPISVSLLTGLPPGKALTTSELSINYLRPPTLNSGTLVGRGRSVYLGREVGVAEATVEDSQGRTMAHATTRCVVLDVPIDENAQPASAKPKEYDSIDPYLRDVPGDAKFGPEIWNENKLDVQRKFIEGDLEKSPIQKLTGLRFVQADEGSCSLTIPASPWFSAGSPFIYGGVLAFACDSALSGAVWSTLDADAVAASLDLQIRFLRPVPLDDRPITIKSSVRHSGRTIRVAEAEAFDADGRRVAIATGSSMVIPGGVGKLKQGLTAEEIVSNYAKDSGS